MTDRDRLIELIEQAEGQINNDMPSIEQIADYLLANGVIVPPCKVGDTVYYVDDFTEETEECKVYGIAVVNGKFKLLVDNSVEKFVATKWYNTKEEAEAKLKEMKGKG